MVSCARHAGGEAGGSQVSQSKSGLKRGQKQAQKDKKQTTHFLHYSIFESMSSRKKVSLNVFQNGPII
jgi:hypothetical protein